MIEPKTWRLIESGECSAGWNMAVDEALLNAFKEGDLPILRLYGWETSMTFGRFSNARKSVDLAQTEALKLPCVRRMSGGGILVHGQDLSYSLILPKTPLKERGVKESYRHLCRFLIALYAKLGHTARFAQELAMESERTNICLAGNEACDIVIEGQKMGGNAQRHTAKALFQHGTIPMQLNAPLFQPLFLEPSGLDNAATLHKLGSPLTYEALAALMKKSFCETFGATLMPDTLRLSEVQSARKLLARKYSQRRWNFDAKHDQS